jgi:hypothetical protein
MVTLEHKDVSQGLNVDCVVHTVVKEMIVVHICN